MAVMALREFECSLCRQRFTLLEGDLILPIPRLCDDCLKAVWDLKGDSLIEYISEFKAKQESKSGNKTGSSIEREFVNSVVKYVQFHREQWGSADEAVGSRERDRVAFGKF